MLLCDFSNCHIAISGFNFIECKYSSLINICVFYLRRAGHDLHYEMDITLKEALLGFRKDITQLDGRKVI